MYDIYTIYLYLLLTTFVVFAYIIIVENPKKTILRGIGLPPPFPLLKRSFTRLFSRSQIFRLKIVEALMMELKYICIQIEKFPTFSYNLPLFSTFLFVGKYAIQTTI